MMNPLNLLSSPRTPHIKQIWSDLAKQPELPQLDRWTVARLKQDKKFGSKDRRFYADAIFTIMRIAMRLPLLQGLEPASAWELLRKQDIDSLFAELEKVSQAEFSDIRAGGLSDWFEPMLAKRREESSWSAADETAFLEGQLARAPLWLRLNHEDRKQKLEKILGDLNTPFEKIGHAYKILIEKNLSATPILEDGMAEVQDYGSQLLGLEVPVKPGDLVWDACAGGGGKSLQLASLHPKAKIFASDIRFYKSSEVEKRALRARLTNITTLRWDGSENLDKPRQAHKGFDIIVVDAPCSGSGTWRRSPDGRFRVSAKSIQDLHELQFSIVKKVLPHLKPKGEIVYATCSWFVEENEAVVRRLQSELSLELIEQSLKGLPTHDADTLFVARLRPQV